MTGAAKKFLGAASALPEDERLALASQLIASVDGPTGRRTATRSLHGSRSSIVLWTLLVIGANLRVTGGKSERACSADSDNEANASAKRRARIHDTGAFPGNMGSG